MDGPKEEIVLADFGILVLRLVNGLLMAGHGSQKLFGWFGGYGIQGTSGWMESLGLRPGGIWARLAGLSEFGSGALTTLGFLNPIGPITMMAPMAMAYAKVHKDKPIWVTEGGAELPLTNVAMATALALHGPGRFSLDSLFGIKLPWPFVAMAMLATAGGIAIGASKPSGSQQTQGTTSREETEDVSGSKLQGGTDAAVVGKSA